MPFYHRNRMWLLSTLGLSSLLVCLFGATTTYAQDVPEEMTYTVTFRSTWSEDTHPHEDFPANAHFSSLIGATHALSTTLWMSGTLASAGIEEMAETGATIQLRSEIDALGDAELETIQGRGLSSATGSVTIQAIHVDIDHPAVTLVTMIAPSPDWFVGVHGLSLLDETGAWQDEVVVTLYPYDAGTDDGVDYTSANLEPEIHQPIYQLRGEEPFSVAPIGTLTFNRHGNHRLYLPQIHKN